MTVPGTSQLIPAINAPLIMYKRQICGVKAVVSIDLYKEVGGDDQAGFNK